VLTVLVFPYKAHIGGECVSGSCKCRPMRGPGVSGMVVQATIASSSAKAASNRRRHTGPIADPVGYGPQRPSLSALRAGSAHSRVEIAPAKSRQSRPEIERPKNSPACRPPALKISVTSVEMGHGHHFGAQPGLAELSSGSLDRFRDARIAILEYHSRSATRKSQSSARAPVESRKATHPDR